MHGANVKTAARINKLIFTALNKTRVGNEVSNDITTDLAHQFNSMRLSEIVGP